MEQYINFNLLSDSTDYITPPHLVPEYRDWMCRYLGVMGQAIKLKKHEPNETEKKALQISFYGKEMYAYDDEKTAYGFGRDYLYELYHYSSDCWTPGCAGNYFIFRISDTQYMVVFNTGNRIYIPKIEITLERQRNHFLDFLLILLELVRLGATEIVLCGHSNGMSSATFTALLLICLARPDVAQYFTNEDLVDETTLDLLDEQIMNKDELKGLENKLVVCGTGGFPILFQTRQEFEVFYETIGTRYLHIGLGFEDMGIVEMDPFMDSDYDTFRKMYHTSIEELYNFNYHVYVYEDRKVIGEPIHSYYTGIGDPSSESINFDKKNKSIHLFDLYRKTLAWYFCR